MDTNSKFKNLSKKECNEHVSIIHYNKEAKNSKSSNNDNNGNVAMACICFGVISGFFMPILYSGCFVALGLSLSILDNYK